MKRFSWRDWVSKFLTLVAFSLVVLVIMAPLTLYSDSEMIKNAKVTSSIAVVLNVISELNALNMVNVKISEEPISLSEILSDYAFDQKYALLGGGLFVVRDAQDGKFYLIWSDENQKPFLTSGQAHRVDRKLDDGLPFSGHVVFGGNDICITQDQTYNTAIEKPCAYLRFDLSKFR